MSLDNMRAKAERCITHHYCDCARYRLNKAEIELELARQRLEAAERVVEAIDLNNPYLYLDDKLRAALKEFDRTRETK
ncbi:MAG: hypothetical protein E6R04_04915 [Spirochaetes bacterium]|nr:MAG: hypothetical protein E6R04_04915 [Spirochaetota bacterium]